MSLVQRQLRARVLETLESRAKQFRTREVLYPIRVPHEPLPLDEVIEEALGDEGRRFDPLSMRARTLLRLEWDDGSVWDAWVVMLPSGLRLFCDAGPEGMHVLASGGRNAGDETDRLFLERLAESAGQDFGIEMAGGAPSRVRSSIDDRAFLVDVFVALFEETGVEAHVREEVADASHATAEADPARRDFRSDVERWLGRALVSGQP
jgi:hypothetical protein